jgi:hypothetical protein
MKGVIITLAKMSFFHEINTSAAPPATIAVVRIPLHIGRLTGMIMD